MQFVKTHWMSLLSGLVAVVGITFAALGMTSDNVQKKMQERVQAANDISGLRSTPHNDATIAAEIERGRKFEQEYEELVRQTEEFNKREPLLEGAFPKPTQVETSYRFREAYTRALWDLPRQLSAGSLPSESELRDEAEVYAEILKRKAEQEGEAAAAKPVERPQDGMGGYTPPGAGGYTPPGAGGFMPPGMGRPMMPGMGPRAGRPGMPGMPGMPGSPQAPTPNMPNVPMEVVRERANVKKAETIRIYASPQDSLHVSPIAVQTDPPEPRDMWYAQVSLWVQEDLVKAIATVNESAARELGEAELGVARMPVKRIESIRVLGYVTSSGATVEFPTASAGRTTGAPAGGGTVVPPSFTGRKSDDRFDVVRAALVVIMDQRDVLQLIDAITRSNFYQLVGFEYAAVESVDPAGYLYGDEPNIRAVFDFEGYMARKIYKPLMPADVLTDLGIGEKSGEGNQNN